MLSLVFSLFLPLSIDLLTFPILFLFLILFESYFAQGLFSHFLLVHKTYMFSCLNRGGILCLDNHIVY